MHDDLVAILLESIANEDLSGPVNAVAPGVVTNTQFTRAMGKVLHRPTIFKAPAFAMRLAAGELADELILASQRVVPARLEAVNFPFAFGSLEQALRFELGKGGRQPSEGALPIQAMRPGERVA
jgi:NAD dependent epimerase/dehydratase family enzyme